MNIALWIGDLFGIEKTAKSLTQKTDTFLAVDPRSMGDDEEKSRAIVLSMSRSEMDSKIDVIAYWSKSLSPLFKQSYDEEKDAAEAYTKIAEIFKEIDDKIKKEEYDSAKDLSKKAIETLELESKKQDLTESIEKEECIVIDGVGVYKCAEVNPGFEFDEKFLMDVLKPGHVASVLPSDFMVNYPKDVYSTYAVPHIARENYAAYLYDTFTVGNANVSNVAVVEKNANGKSTYYIIGGCDEARFTKICRMLTPTYNDFNLKYDNGKVSRRAVVSSVYKKAEAVDADYNKLADEFVAKFKEDKRDAAHMQSAVNSFAEEKKVNADKLQDAVNTVKNKPENKEPQKLETMNIGAELSVEAKKKKDKQREMMIETNIDTCGKDEWRLDQGANRPTEEATGFYTPLIVGFNHDAGTYDVKFMQGVRKNLNTDTVKTYLYNAGFTWKDVADVLEDAKKEDVVLYGESHKKAADFIRDIQTIVKSAKTETAANSYIDSLTLNAKEKADIKTMVSGVMKTAVTEKAKEFVSNEISKAVDADIPQDQAAAIAYSKADAKGYKVPEKKSELDDAAKILKENPDKVEVLAEFVDECYRDEVINKDTHHAFYHNLDKAIATNAAQNWNTLCKVAEMIYVKSVSVAEAIEKKDEILQDVPKQDFERGVEMEKSEHPDLPGEAITLEHLDEHKNYYDLNQGLPAFEKNLEKMEEGKNDGAKDEAKPE